MFLWLSRLSEVLSRADEVRERHGAKRSIRNHESERIIRNVAKKQICFRGSVGRASDS